MPLIPDPISSDIYDVQADARDGRFTWRREANNRLVPGLVVLGRPSLRMDPSGIGRSAEVDAAASQDDILAWAFAARWWITRCWLLYSELEDRVKSGQPGAQLEEYGATNPDSIPPTFVSLVNGRSLGGIEILEGGNAALPWLLTGSWTQYFVSLVAQVVLQSVKGSLSNLVAIQVAMRQASATFVGMVGDEMITVDGNGLAEFPGPVQARTHSLCQLARAWRVEPTAACKES